MNQVGNGISRFGIIRNGEKRGTDILVARVHHFLERRNLRCIDFAYEELGATDTLGEGIKEALGQIECLIVVGGDGTILRQVNTAAVFNIPILGINMGTVGFLSEVEPNWIEEALLALTGGRYREERRNLLCGEADGESKLALNDFLLCKKHPSRTIEVSIAVDGQVVAEYDCDGVLVSTPTGSTGYALSAGGPILSPELPLTMVTPVCAHKLTARAMLFSMEAEIALQLLADHDNAALVCADGDTVFRPFAKGDILSVRKTSQTLRFLRIREENYFNLVRQKLG